MSQKPMTADDFASLTNVSRETLSALKAYVDLLRRWNERQNLIARSTVDDIWRRHVLDSFQLNQLIPDTADSLVDVGSGAGLPGLVLAILRRTEAAFKVSLVDSSQRKCSFLTLAAHELDLDVDVMNCRVETLSVPTPDVVTARACAPLSQLLALVSPLVEPGTVCLFPKGQHVEAELTEAAKYWTMTIAKHPSLTSPASTILRIEGITRVRT